MIHYTISLMNNKPVLIILIYSENSINIGLIATTINW
jgi:hypothetical protein